MARAKTPGAFGRNIDALRSSLQQLKTRHLGYVHHDLTEDDLLSIYIPAEHRELLKAAYALTKVPSGWVSSESFHAPVPLNDPSTTTRIFATIRKPSSYIPVDLQEPSSSEPLSRLQRYIEQCFELEKEYAFASKVLTTLNEKCSTCAQVRFLWPAVLQLMKIASLPTDSLGARVPSQLPALPAGFREAAAHAGGVITAATLLEDPPKQPGDIHIERNQNILVDLPWGGTIAV